ncbi:hypothetical protein MTO96_007331 [Rhipicephalus appendiculatus]
MGEDSTFDTGTSPLSSFSGDAADQATEEEETAGSSGGTSRVLPGRFPPVTPRTSPGGVPGSSPSGSGPSGSGPSGSGPSGSDPSSDDPSGSGPSGSSPSGGGPTAGPPSTPDSSPGVPAVTTPPGYHHKSHSTSDCGDFDSVNKSLFAEDFCDYAVFPDLIARNKSFTPLYGQTAWNTFKESAAAAQGVEVGLGFTLDGLGKPGNTIDLVPSMSMELSRLVRSLNASAMGAFANAVSMARTIRMTEPMTFLGVWLTSTKDSTNFVADVQKLNYVTTIILQTHISMPYGHYQDCVSLPVSLMTGTSVYPTFEIAAIAAMNLHAMGDRFRIVFSSTLGVMTFVGLKSSGSPKGPNQNCTQAFMTGIDSTCSTSLPTTVRRGYEQREHFAYIIYEANSNLYYATYETEKSLAEKMNLYIVHISDGWALFEVDRDTRRPCGRMNDDYPRLASAQQQARLRQMVDVSALPSSKKKK